MENAEEIFHYLEDFSKRKPKTIPQELNEYLAYVARTGDPVYQWSLVKSLFKEKLLSVITDFYETTPGIEIPPYPNVDPFNYDVMKNSLLERLDSFTSAPFTVQRICELLTFPRKQYNRIDKFMRAIEKNILVVSTREPGHQRQAEENGETNEPIVNGSDNNSEYNVDVEMEDMSWKENSIQQAHSEPQPSSSDTHITVDNIEARLKAKESQMNTQDKTATQYESVTPPELNVTNDQSEEKPSETINNTEITIAETDQKQEEVKGTPSEEPKTDVEMKNETNNSTSALVIPEIRVDDAEMTEQKLLEAKIDKEKIDDTDGKQTETVAETVVESSEKESPQITDESSSDSKEELDSKHPEAIPTSKESIIEATTERLTEVTTPDRLGETTADRLEDVTERLGEVATERLSEVMSSEESSSSSDNTDGSSSSPKTDEGHIDIQDESNQSDSNASEPTTDVKPVETSPSQKEEESVAEKIEIPPKIESDNYSISDVNSELKEPVESSNIPVVSEQVKEEMTVDEVKNENQDKDENVENNAEKESETQN